uniref:G-protein coupled receptors family 2 profile 2 domain-containing protein n=3 Tax=Ciona intestinalis TaxID=7719 RepID=F6RC45_CIOIN
MNIALPLAVYERIRTHIQRVSFVVYKDKFLFPSNATVMSSVISAELPQVNTQGLSSPIVITANVKLPDNSSLNLIKCSFWNFTTLSWRSEGCEVANISSSVDERGYSTITCHCNHLTNFAVLLNHDTRENPTVEDNEITELISYAGIIASIIGLSITIIFRLSRREFRRGVPQIILLHLCFCLLIVYIMMLIYDKSFVVQHMGSCFLVGFLMHYFLLSSWGWCLTEGVSMYLLLVQVYNVNLRRFLTKATICCYGAASLLVCGSLILSGSSADVAEHPGYIVLDAYRYGDACVVTYPNSLYFVIIPIAVACSLNLVCFVFVIKGLRQTAASDGMGGTKKKNMVKHRLRQAVCVTTLLGVTWCIGFVKVALQSSFGTTSDVVWAFEILFSAVNSVQGFVIFLMFCAANLWSEFRCTTGPDKKRGRLYSQTSKLGSTSNEKVAAVTATTHQSSTA